jgi:hypothetical protein
MPVAGEVMQVPAFVERAHWFSLHVAHSLDALRHPAVHAQRFQQHLARIKGMAPAPNPHAVIFFAADSGFMQRFGFALIASCYEHARECGVHVHLYAPTPEILQRLGAAQGACAGMQISYTYEDEIDYGTLPDRGMYYTAFRFVALRKLLEDSRSLFICLDADSLVVNSLQAMIADARRCDMGLYFRLSRRHLNKKIAAFCVIANHTAGALQFLDLFAAIAMTFHRHYRPFRSNFYFDQSALYASYLIARLRWRSTFYAIAKTAVDYDFGNQACIWTAKGMRKHDQRFLDESRRMLDAFEPSTSDRAEAAT